MTMFLQMENYQKLGKMKDDPHRQRGKICCNRSGICCWTRPSRLTREELKRFADFKDVSESVFFKEWCAVDQMFGKLCVILRRHHQQGGEWITDDESYSLETPCVFFEDKTRVCIVHHIKPAECARHECWNKKDIAHPNPEWTRQQILDLGWNGCDDE